MENILYLDDYINLYNKRHNKIIIKKPYKETLENGKIINKEKFIKVFNKIISENKLNKNIFNNEITVIINSLYRVEDKKILLDVLESLNYKRVKIIKEINLLKINKDTIYINASKSYILIYYIDNFGNVSYLTYTYNMINKILLPNIIKNLDFKKIIVYGKNYEEVISILDKGKINYFYYEDSKNFILKNAISKEDVKY